MYMSKPSLADLQRAVQISEQIEKLEAELKSVLSGFDAGNAKNTGSQASTKRLGRPAKRDAVIVSQPTGHETGGDGSKPKRKKSKMSAEGRAKIVAAVKARWAREKGAK